MKRRAKAESQIRGPAHTEANTTTQQEKDKAKERKTIFQRKLNSNFFNQDAGADVSVVAGGAPGNDFGVTISAGKDTQEQKMPATSRVESHSKKMDESAEENAQNFSKDDSGEIGDANHRIRKSKAQRRFERERHSLSDKGGGMAANQDDFDTKDE